MARLPLRIAVTALLACPLVGSAQESTFQVVTERVLLDLIVRDSEGRPVRDLRPGEIEVYENGVRQDITNFRFVGEETASLSEPQGSGEVEFNPFEHVNLIALVFERLQDESRRLARDAALRFVEKGMRKNTLMAVFAIHHRLYVLQQFTNNGE
ncbi:MAG: hypothetical protein ACREQV_07255, partial [Candidatus Binatia bacterium]